VKQINVPSELQARSLKVGEDRKMARPSPLGGLIWGQKRQRLIASNNAFDNCVTYSLSYFYEYELKQYD